MARPTLSDSEFIEMFRALGAAGMSRKTGMSERGLYARRARLEQKMQKPVRAETGHLNVKEGPEEHPGRLLFDVPDGVVLVASDAHYWPGIVTTAHKAFVRFCRVMKPKLVIMNGDVLDGADGDDTLRAGAGNDQLTGGAGHRLGLLHHRARGLQGGPGHVTGDRLGLVQSLELVVDYRGCGLDLRRRRRRLRTAGDQ